MMRSTLRSGAMLAAGGTGLALGLLASPMRKLAVQAPTMLKGRWDEALAAEHAMTRKLLDAIEATDAEDTARRTMMLTQLKHALAKHSFQEENVVYAMMRERDMLEPAQHLNEDHAEVKRLLFDLTELKRSDPQWIAKIGELRSALEEHMTEEEDELFPRLRDALSEDENAHLATMMNREGLKLA